MSSNKSCNVQRIDNGFLVSTSYDPNDYTTNQGYDVAYAPTISSTMFASSPEQIGTIIADFYNG